MIFNIKFFCLVLDVKCQVATNKSQIITKYIYKNY